MSTHRAEKNESTAAKRAGRTTEQPSAPLRAAGTLLQRAQADPSSLTPADVLHLQRSIGNRTGRLLAQSLPVQTKLQLGPANDKYEQEADDRAASATQRRVRRGDSGEAYGEVLTGGVLTGGVLTGGVLRVGDGAGWESGSQ